MSDGIVYDREEDGRWIAEYPAVAGCLAYGDTKREARRALIELMHEMSDNDADPS